MLLISGPKGPFFMHKKLEQYISSLDSSIDQSRKPILQQLAAYVEETDQPKLNFICTHNSRRSHLSQIWAQVFAHYFGIEVATFSGGTETTAFHPNAVEALRRAGLEISGDERDNPRYNVSFSDRAESLVCFSKTFDDEFNPTNDFAAIMTCSEADSGCPFVPGASARIKLFYEDPKEADETPAEAKTYDERCTQIAREMRYVFSIIKGKK